jgi:acetyl esterase/lipase
LYEPWFPQWLLELATAKNAIIVSPNYRLLPESSGLDILEDLDDLWRWMKFGLQLKLNYFSVGLRADLDRIITEGDSAGMLEMHVFSLKQVGLIHFSGGYLSIQFAMNHPDKIKACIAEFPSIDLESPHFASTGNGTPLGSPSLVNDHLVLVGNVNKTSSDMTLARFPLINALIQEGKFLHFFGNEPRLFPLRRLETGARLPPLFIIHGANDTIVPVEGSLKFAKLLLEKNPDTKVVLTVQPGEHGVSIPFGMEHPWLAEGLKLVTDAWDIQTE